MSLEFISTVVLAVAVFGLGVFQKTLHDGREDVLRRITELERRATAMETNYKAEFKLVREQLTEVQFTILNELSSIKVNCAAFNHRAPTKQST